MSGATRTTAGLVVVMSLGLAACGDDAPSAAEPTVPSSTTGGHPQMHGVWDVTLATVDVHRSTGDTVRFTCGGRLEIDVQRDSLFSGTLILRDTCAQFGGIDGQVTRNGDVPRLTYTVTVGIGYCEVLEGDRSFHGTVSGHSLAVGAVHVRRCGEEVSDRTLELTGARRVAETSAAGIRRLR